MFQLHHKKKKKNYDEFLKRIHNMVDKNLPIHNY